jgi:sugar transferase (PEP-CTERM system associated)
MASNGSHPSSRTVLLMVCEAVFIVGAVALASWIRLGPDSVAALGNGRGLLKALLVAASCQHCLYYADLYDLRVVADRRELFVRTMQALGATSFILAAVYYFFPALVLGRGVFIIAAALIIGLTIGWRMVFMWGAGLCPPRERLLIVGTSDGATRLARELQERWVELGTVIIGFVDSEPGRVGQSLPDGAIIGSVDDIPALVKAYAVDRVVVSLADARGKLPMNSLLDIRLDGVRFAHLSTLYEEYTGKIAVENLRPSLLVFSEGFGRKALAGRVSRLIDLCGAGVLFVLTLPLTALAAVLVKLTSPGPALYRQSRVGLNGRVFTIYKFRSMRVDAEAGTGPVWSVPGYDSRVTRVGALLRRSRLDELPQLWNVIRGDMSLVGPRPERPEFVELLTRGIRFYGLRHTVRPGLTGWAQVRYPYAASVESAMEKLQYDLFYIKHRSFALDLYIMLETLKTVITRSGS